MSGSYILFIPTYMYMLWAYIYIYMIFACVYIRNVCDITLACGVVVTAMVSRCVNLCNYAFSIYEHMHKFISVLKFCFLGLEPKFWKS